MKKSISLKEFSTTPTVSYMLSKDGHNLATSLHHLQAQQVKAPTSQPPKDPPKQKPADNDDVMYEME
ncbi:unnamed protein product [Phytomonas sp. EM1]|nr:unnamed protein product [Phytomonas sp. EM1]|eukprot:CCW59741.1 unnamed protein product [Phytomonas sp. isolate EM1]